MCTSRKKLRLLSVFSVLFFLCAFSPSPCSCSAEVVLTDEEAMELQSEMEKSRMELQNVKDCLIQSQQDLIRQKEVSEDVRNTYEEQRKSYETQLEEKDRKNETLTVVATSTGTASVIFAVLMIVFIIL